MPAPSPTLPDLMVMLPDLHPKRLLTTEAASIRQLRLVSKEVGRIALTAVTACEVFLGEGSSSPDPEQLARLMSTAQLEKLRVAVTDLSGRSISPITTQQSISDVQMEYLLTGMGSAIKSVTDLSLHVQCLAQSITTNQVVQDSHVANFAHWDNNESDFLLPRSISISLAPALSFLRHLHLSGLCNDVALCAFGTHCPQLTHLDVEVCTVSVQALQDIHHALPALAHLTITRKSATAQLAPQQEVKDYINAVIPILSGCQQLKVFELDLLLAVGDVAATVVRDTFVECEWDLWNTLCSSINELRSNVRLHWLITSKRFMSRLRVMKVASLPSLFLHHVFTACPLLKQLTISGDEASELVSEVERPITREQLQLLKTRLTGDFQLSCKNVTMSGASEDIRDVISWLSPLLNVTQCVLETPQDDNVPNCLEQFKRVFPNVVRLHLYHGSVWAYAPVMEEGFLAPLAGLKHLERLGVCVQLRHTHAGMVSLCSGLPALVRLSCMPCVGICQSSVMAELLASGREVLITELNQSEFNH